MQRIYQPALLLIFLTFASEAFAQLDTLADENAGKDWNIGGLISVNFSQSAFNNWAAGGENNVGLATFYKPFANYAKGKITWENTLDLRYGKNKTGEQGWRKSDDLIDLNSKLGIQAADHWYYSALANFVTQFDNGYADAAQTEKVSAFMAPGYLTLALGMDYKPNENLSLFLSPLTTRTTFVSDDSLSAAGAYGVDLGDNAWTQLGPSAVFNYKNEIIENVMLDTKIRSMYEYASDAKFVFNWDLILSMKVNKFLSTTITTGLIYDENVLFNVTDDAGNVTGQEKRWQFKEVLAIGITFNY